MRPERGTHFTVALRGTSKKKKRGFGLWKGKQ